MKSAHPDEVAVGSDFLVLVSGASIEMRALVGRLEAAGAKVEALPEGTALDPAMPGANLVLCDLASDGALALVDQYYTGRPGDAPPHLITLGSPRGDLSEPEAALLARARHRFRRPLDIQGVVDGVLGTLRQPRVSTRAPQSQGELSLASLKPRSSQAPRLSVPSSSERAPSSQPSSRPSVIPPEDAVAVRQSASPAPEHSVVSAELETLLAEAERRVQAQFAVKRDAIPSAPPNGGTAHLSEDVWEALGEPLDDDADNPLPEASIEEGAPPSPLALDPSERSVPPAGDSTLPPALWRDALEEETGSRAPPPESEQTSGSIHPLTTAGGSGAPSTLAPGQARDGGPRIHDESSDADGPETQTPSPASTTPPSPHRAARLADTRPPMVRASPHPRIASLSVGASSTPGSEDGAGTSSPEEAESDRAPLVSPSSVSHPLELPGALVRGASAQVIGRAVRQRFTGCLAFEVDQGLRRVVFKDGDVVIAASAVHGESLVSFLAQRGDVASETVAQIEHRIPIFGRHSGAALIARGLLEQSELWPVLRSHAEWVLAQLLTIERGGVQVEHPVPERLAAEPAVFGGATGAEVLVEAIQRAVPPAQALAYLGNEAATLVPGGAAALLSECALSPKLTALVKRAEHSEIGTLLAEAHDEPMLPCVLYALWVLDVVAAKEPARRPATQLKRARQSVAPDRIDDDALRARVQARRALVDEGDYFALLGVPRRATGYDIRRSYVELRRQFDPGQVLRPNTLDLEGDVDTILEVLDEAYEILRDQQRRERYRRAIESTP